MKVAFYEDEDSLRYDLCLSYDPFCRDGIISEQIGMAANGRIYVFLEVATKTEDKVSNVSQDTMGCIGEEEDIKRFAISLDVPRIITSGGDGSRYSQYMTKALAKDSYNFMFLETDLCLELVGRLLETKGGRKILEDNIGKFLISGGDFSIQLADELLGSEYGRRILSNNLRNFLVFGEEFRLPLLNKLLESQYGCEILTTNLQNFLDFGFKSSVKVKNELKKSASGNVIWMEYMQKSC